MDRAKVEDIDYTNHEKKCRVCFKLLNTDELCVEISNTIEKKFRDVTQTTLEVSSDYSKKICMVCNFQLIDFCEFKRNVISLQKGLYSFASGGSDGSIKNEREDSVIIKTEIEHLDEYCDDLEPDEGDGKDTQHQSEFLDLSCEINYDDQYENDDHDEIDDSCNRKSMRFKCSECNLSASHRHLIQKHFKMVHQTIELEDDESTNFSCPSCVFVFDSQESLLSHNNQFHANKKKTNSHKIKIHLSDKDLKWVCQHCNASFSGSRALRDHVTVMHETIKPQIPCPVMNCNKVFLTTKRLRAHTRVHDDDAKEMCPECGLLLTSKHNLQKHINRVHLKLRNFFCDLCGYSATFRHSIASHMVSHIDPKERRKWNCDLCTFVSVSKQSLRAHKSYEHSGTVYTCHCGKQFNQRASLSTHIKCVHHKIKDHLCNLCGKAYFSRNDLKNHKKSQHMEKDMPCEICGKLFATQKHLTRHRMYHDEPKYKCDFEGCTKAFIDNAKLKDHQKLHEGNRDHLCHLCEKSYFHQKDLKRHLDVAHKATIFYCEVCPFTISRKDYLRNHLNSAHKHLSLEEKNDILARTKVTRNSV